MLTALVAIVLGTALAVAIGWLLLSGILRMTFHRARTALRRLRERRGAARAEADRRANERRV
jgi:hypothetical protein